MSSMQYDLSWQNVEIRVEKNAQVIVIHFGYKKKKYDITLMKNDWSAKI